MRAAIPVQISDEERKELTRYSRGRRVEARVVLRARIILMAADGHQNKKIAAALQTDPGVVRRWRMRFAEGGISAILKDAPRSGRKQPAELAQQVLEITFNESPPNGKRWSTRSIADRLGVSHATIARIWKQSSLRPHLDRADRAVP